jgi:Flp pilus assembly protein TadD
VFAFIVALGALGAPSSADVARDATVCSDERASADRVISACSGVIADPAVAPMIKYVAFKRRADAYFSAKGDYDRAVADATEAIKLNAADPAVFAMRGGFHLAYNEFDKAIADFAEAIKLDPDDAAVLSGRAYAYVQLGKTDEAITDYSEVVRLKPDDANVRYDRGGAYEKKEAFDLARADYEAAIRLQRDYAGEFPDTCFGMNDKGERGLKNWPRCESSD